MQRFAFAVGLSMLFWAGHAHAQDVQRLEPEKVKKYATKLTEAAGKLTDLPFKLTADLDKATALAKDKHAALVVPDAKLSLEAIKKIDTQTLPIGVLYAHKLTPVSVEVAIPLDKHRTVEIEEGDVKATISVMPLAIAKVAGRLVLLAYTSEKTPTLVAPLIEQDDAKDFPLDLEALPAGNNRAVILVHVLGKYRAAIPVTAQE